MLCNEIENLIARFPYSPGRNLRRELSRLLFEVSLKENITPRYLCDPAAVCAKKDAIRLRRELLLRRFPGSDISHLESNAYLPPLSYRETAVLKPGDCRQEAREIYYENGLAESALLGRLRRRFPQGTFRQISSFKEYCLRERRPMTPEEYNRRRRTIFLLKERFDFFKKCPCTSGVVSCGYYIFNLGFGCPFECSYCYLQHYQDHPGIVLCDNVTEYLSRFDDFLAQTGRTSIRIGTGEFTDSLALDDITAHSRELVAFFSRRRVRFELKTKSAAIDNLLDVPASPLVTVSWSLNPQPLIETDEPLTASLDERLDAARRCAGHGYSLGFHFDPLIACEDWEREYKELVDRLFETVGGYPISWISLGTLRFNKDLKTIAEQRFPQSRIFLGELLPGMDGKMRYPRALRRTMYRKLIDWIRHYNRETWIYLCMEDKEMWREVRK